MEWIIVDDGTDRIRDLVESSGITQIKYFEMPKKVSLGEKRNYMHSKATGGAATAGAGALTEAVPAAGWSVPGSMISTRSRATP